MTSSFPFIRLASAPLTERASMIASGDVDLVAAVSSASKLVSSDPLNAFITPTPSLAQRGAEEVSAAVRSGAAKPLAGTILAVKDNIALEGEPLTCASRILEGYRSSFTSTALQRLLDAGVVVVGKTNLDEFAMGSSTEYSAYGAVRHPLDRERAPGGSSGGSAAAVAAGYCTAALGSETGGSVRQPAAFCGLVGIKPTYGRISRYGLVAFGSSLDQIGVFAKTPDECARIFETMAGLDPKDNTSSPVAVPDCSGGLGGALEGLRVGLPVEYLGEGIQPEIAVAVNSAADAFRRMGAAVMECSLPHTRFAIPVYYILAPAEASSNLARYDGVRYGPRAADSAEEAADIIRLSRQAGFGTEVKRRIMIGTYVLSSGYYDAFYLKAQRVRRLITEDFLKVFASFDLLLTPTTPTTAFKLGEKLGDPVSMYLADIFTAPANLSGVPAISVPLGSDDRGMPIGLQLMAPHFREDLLFNAAAKLEEAR